MPFTSRLNTIFTTALTLVALQVFGPSLSPTPIAPAQAGGSVKYQPPKRNTPQRTEGTGTRSSSGFQCPTSQKPLFIAALSPTTHAGDTVSARPTLYTYFSGTESIDVKLREIGTIDPVWKHTLQAPKPGFSAIAYPSDAPELVEGKSYQWSVEVVCDATKRYLNKGYTSAKIQRVSEPEGLKDTLGKATTAIDRAQIYAERGLWYEALDSIASASLAAPTDTALRTQLIDLLEQGGLVKAANQAREANLSVKPIPGALSRIRPANRLPATKIPTGSPCQAASTAPVGLPTSDRTRCP